MVQEASWRRERGWGSGKALISKCRGTTRWGTL
jgi:hypothetical protein